MKRMRLAILSLILMLNACAVGSRHTSDAALERIFQSHQAEFESLLAEVQADSQLMTLQRSLLIFGGQRVDLRENDLSAIERAGLVREHWMHYQDQLQRLGLFGVMKDGNGRVEFRMDSGSMWNGDSYKGFEYRTTLPRHTRNSLDDYRISEEDRNQFGGWLVYRAIKGPWYLYLFVNH
jgi:hypothetical protein